MATVLLALGLIACIGSILRYLLHDLDVEMARRVIGDLVLNIFLPALVFRVIFTAQMGAENYQIPLVMLLSILVCLAISIVVFRAFRLQPEEKGALILASAFGNVTYLGLPVLQGLFTSLQLEVAKVAILSEITTTPLNLSLGMALGSGFKQPQSDRIRAASSVFMDGVRIAWNVCQEMIRLPALWAVCIAILWKFSGVPVPAFLLQATQILGNTVTGLMMLSLGMGLRYQAIRKPFPLVVASIIKLLVSPFVVFAIASWIGVAAPFFDALVLEGAMPSQLLTFVIADRVGLNAERLALCILVNTAASFFTIPLIKTFLLAG